VKKVARKGKSKKGRPKTIPWLLRYVVHRSVKTQKNGEEGKLGKVHENCPADLCRSFGALVPLGPGSLRS